EQLKFEANVVVYVNYLSAALTTKKLNAPAPRLQESVPIYGPRFLPPSLNCTLKRDPSGASVDPTVLYLKPVNVIHPFYYPTSFRKCPQCQSEDTKCDGWTGSGTRSVHGVSCEERAIGMQLRCNRCKDQKDENGKSRAYCFASTSSIFWDNVEHWEIPRGIPHFRYQTALTPELFNLIIETRISSTSAGLAEHIHQLHLLEYQKRVLEYLEFFQLQLGYNDCSISDQIITAVLLHFNKTRQKESADLMKSLTGHVLSLDATFRAAKKATISDSDKQRTSVATGGVSKTLAWVS
ncbi:hypothetical protein EV361DRAFT_809410, partial [Lentinula raphanica]